MYKYFGLDFPNKDGVAGGLDKNANYFHVLGNLGFGFTWFHTKSKIICWEIFRKFL